MLLVLDTVDAPADVAGRRLRCPWCPGRLAPWASARPRVVSMLDGRRVSLTPLRGRCTGCRRTQVLLPAWAAPRRAHGVEVIATALAARWGGHGHRVIAQRLGVAAGTVRGWVRRIGARVEALRLGATGRLAAGDPAVVLEPTGSELGDALDALAAVVEATRRRLGRDEPDLVWGLIGGLGLAQQLAPARGG